jgi:UDP-N-acetylglucosamine/UDP-N-acetylgalactosamine diphosphorylase
MNPIPSHIIDKLSSLGQSPLLDTLRSLPASKQSFLLTQIATLDFFQLKNCIDLLSNPVAHKTEQISPLQKVARSGNLLDVQEGQKLIAEGRCGAIILAGGQGTRLNFDGPKGMFPVTLVKHKSLFQLFAEKTVAASKQVGLPLSIAIMTSPQNDSVTREFFAENHYFGLSSTQLSFFSQGMFPLLDADRHLFLDEEEKIVQGPDGNGAVFFHLVQKGIWKLWQSKGIQYANVVLIDNPLADPFDADLVGFHARRQCDITIKGCLRENASEKVGLLVIKNGKIQVAEYSEIPPEERNAYLPDGSLKYPYANLSLFCLGMEIIKSCAEKQHLMPWHAASKKFQNKDVWKFEKFIFDLLSFFNKTEVLIYPREECFAPLKNKTGPDSLTTVQAALQHNDRRVIEKITGIKPPEKTFELSQDFLYPTPKLLKDWQGRFLPNDAYIEP